MPLTYWRSHLCFIVEVPTVYFTLARTEYRVGKAATSARWPFFEEPVRLSMPRVTCTMQIVAHRLGWAGRRWCRRASHKVMLEVRFWTTFPYRGGAKPSQMVRWQTKDWPYGRCPDLGHPRIVASEAWDRSLSPWFGTRPASLLAALFPHRSWRGHYSVSRSYGASTHQAFALG
jgi:hypothetical protein